MTPLQARKAMNRHQWAQSRVYRAAGYKAFGPEIQGFCIVDGPGGHIVIANGEPLLFPSFKEAATFLKEIHASYAQRPRKPVSPAAREAQRQWKRIALGRL